ncbi:unnamed protein product [Orchesella dallaii]|uniref:Uncharacterized protein n=1 Tax=Orchesella dallaii TaxID=48710 RepID=A0ABP1RBK4_9HEXA
MSRRRLDPALRLYDHPHPISINRATLDANVLNNQHAYIRYPKKQQQSNAKKKETSIAAASGIGSGLSSELSYSVYSCGLSLSSIVG